jgi:uncharacterized protein (TIGR03067 family)
MMRCSLIGNFFISIVISILMLSGCSKSGNSSDPNGPANPLAELQGSWAGTQTPDTTFLWTITFKGDSVTVGNAHTLYLYGGHCSINSSTSPKSIDMTVITCPDYPTYVGKLTYGIYTLSGDRLTWAANEPGNVARPTSFTDPQARVFRLVKQ